MKPDDSKKSGRKESRRGTTPWPRFQPEFLLDFIELPQFTRRWEALGLDAEADLTDLQVMIMVDPKGGDIVIGAGGLRKLRFAPERWNTGKSGAARVLYLYFEEFGIVLLCLVYAKNEVSTISAAVKKVLRRLIAETEHELRRLKAMRKE